MHPTRATAEQPRADRVLSRAFCRAAEALDVAQKEQAKILGVSAASVSRLQRGERVLEVDSKEGELALLFVRLFRSLDTMVGGDSGKARDWLHAHNRHLGGVPAERLATIPGLLHVVEYLDAMRARV